MTSGDTKVVDIPEAAQPYVDRVQLAGATPFDYYAAIIMLNGLTRKHVAEIIGKSKPYVTAMRNINARTCLGALLAWKDGHIPFDIVRTLSKIDAHDQPGLLDNYLNATKSKTKSSRGEAKRELHKALIEQNHNERLERE